ncbi:bifunctional 5-dehydro-2-deoxygluconokinase/5-dehydro-2-deoxyphosphogluconate aldolase [Rhizorhapis suberifaciens]|uniref:5-dehydro-2-deoxygluconokinase n=1 Tax=Rhizorhapis suberifaciens TaxID=13656 RepID=A0A840HXL5_9SPHN|nr:5-dehydro-2-deoxygluconokinase [Rhizorhapis suberifaciens]MBB4642835.1 5-dehydro-2-deoxygluconokinase [Rhizorhapis suberifaciens]
MQHTAKQKRLDLIAIGRASVDLYGQQVGGRLEDMTSFAKYLGGSPANTVVGVTRLGLQAGLLTRVGNDHMGRFIREQLEREGADTSGIIVDDERLTALVILGISDPDTFPLIFYRENCADMALCVDDIDPEVIASSGALLVNGTHLSREQVFAASLKAAEIMKANGGRVVFDIDYRPVLWGLASKDKGEDRFVASAAVTAELQRMLPLCDLVVGTEEEIHILGGTTDTIAALRAIREVTGALLVCKRGPEGCVAFPGSIPDDLDGGIIGNGFQIEVFNVLGAGDAFMAGFLRGWLRGEPIERCCTWANACGAIVVSRHGCAPAAPSWEELELFLSRDDWPQKLRDSTELEQLHWSTNRPASGSELTVLAIDHRSQFEELVADLGRANLQRIGHFKELALQALQRVAGSHSGFGLLADGRFGMRALEKAAGSPLWIGRPIELPGSRPIEFEGSPDVATTLMEWPRDHVVKCLIFYHPDDPAELREQQDRQLLRLFDACRSTGHQLLLEIIASKAGLIDGNTVPRVIDHLYNLGIFPDWWKLEPMADREVWANISKVINHHDPHCCGVVLLGLSASQEELLESFTAVADIDVVKGFAVGRTIWQKPAEAWLKGDIGDDEAVDVLANNFSALVEGWRTSRRGAAA